MLNNLYNLIVHFMTILLKSIPMCSLLACLSPFLLVFKRSLYMKDMNPLPVVSVENIPLPSLLSN